MKTPKKQYFLSPFEVQEIIGCKRTKAFNIIKDLNRELKEMGYRTVNGLIPTKFFLERYNLASLGPEQLPDIEGPTTTANTAILTEAR